VPDANLNGRPPYGLGIVVEFPNKNAAVGQLKSGAQATNERGYLRCNRGNSESIVSG
jgi:hypothetical protein